MRGPAVSRMNHISFDASGLSLVLVESVDDVGLQREIRAETLCGRRQERRNTSATGRRGVRTGGGVISGALPTRMST